MQAEHRTGFQVGDVTIDLVRREMRRGGGILPCGPLTFEFFALLAEFHPRVVTREVVVERLWAGRYVSPATVKRRVALLRATLGDRADAPVYIRVTRGKGYSLIPGVVPIVRPLPSSRRLWRFGMVAAMLVFAFLLGAEVAYQDGLRPHIPALQGTAAVYVTAEPYELAPADFAFVMGTAESFLAAIRESGFLDETVVSAGSAGREPVAIVARAATNDLDSLHLTLAVLADSRPDLRVNRSGELESWSRELQDAPVVRNGTATFVEQPAQDMYRSHVVVPAEDRARNFLLIANLSFDRNGVRLDPVALRAKAVRAVTSVIEQRRESRDL